MTDDGRGTVDSRRWTADDVKSIETLAELGVLAVKNTMVHRPPSLVHRLVIHTQTDCAGDGRMVESQGLQQHRNWRSR